MPETLSYATPASRPSRQSLFASASIAVACVCVIWEMAAVCSNLLPFDVYKQNRIGMVAGLLSIILAFAAYRQPFRRRGLAHVAITVSVLAFLFAAMAQPL